MKSSLILGVVFIIIGGVIGYIQYNGSNDPFLTFNLIIGVLLGAGLGLLFGAIMGYSSKSQSVKRKARMQQQELSRKNEDNSSTSSGV